jgi:hypothetical protein
MWIDARGSEVLPVSECRRLLAVAAKHGHHGHLGIPTEGAPVVLPLDFGVHGSDVVLQVGDSLFHRLDGRLVAFQVDSETADPGWTADAGEGRWSVLVRGLALAVDTDAAGDGAPQPRVAEPGTRLVLVRADVVTGRRLRAPDDGES